MFIYMSRSNTTRTGDYLEIPRRNESSDKVIGVTMYRQRDWIQLSRRAREGEIGSDEKAIWTQFSLITPHRFMIKGVCRKRNAELQKKEFRVQEDTRRQGVHTCKIFRVFLKIFCIFSQKNIWKMKIQKKNKIWHNFTSLDTNFYKFVIFFYFVSHGNFFIKKLKFLQKSTKCAIHVLVCSRKLT